MAQEEQEQRCNISGINNVIGRSSGKKPKEKKIPQRGLGVAQLEKIRLEEQHKRVSNYHHHSNHSSSSSSSLVSFLSLSDNVDAARPNSDIPGDFNVPKLWNSSCGHLNLPQEFNPIWAQQSRRPNPSVVNFPLTPSSLSSVSSFKMELPSNQSYHRNNSLIYPDEEVKMLGNKRRCTFVDIDHPGSSFNSNLVTFADQTRVDELSSSENRVTFNSEPRDSGLSSTSIPEPNSTMKNLIENSALNGNFLSLSPPVTTTTWTSPISSFDLHSSVDCKIPDFDTTPFQGIVNGQKFQDEQSGSSKYMPFYSFFPPAERHNYESSEATRHCCTGGADDQSVDLNLKL